MTRFEGVSAVVAQRLKQLRKQQGLSASALAARCVKLDAPEVKEQTIYNMEQGRSEPRMSHCVVLAIALSVPLSSLVVPEDPDDDIALTPRINVQASRMGKWVAGHRPLPLTDPEVYASAARELPGQDSRSDPAPASVEARTAWIVDQIDDVADNMAQQLAQRFQTDIAAFIDSLPEQNSTQDSLATLRSEGKNVDQ